jgi:hypothetical protein
MHCKIWGLHGGDYEERRLQGYKNIVRTSQETHYVSVTELSRLMQCKIWGFHGGDYEECIRIAFSNNFQLNIPSIKWRKDIWCCQIFCSFVITLLASQLFIDLLQLWCWHWACTLCALGLWVQQQSLSFDRIPKLTDRTTLPTRSTPGSILFNLWSRNRNFCKHVFLGAEPFECHVSHETLDTVY